MANLCFYNGVMFVNIFLKLLHVLSGKTRINGIILCPFRSLMKSILRAMHALNMSLRATGSTHFEVCITLYFMQIIHVDAYIVCV